MMKYLVAMIRGMHAAVGISLPTPEQEKKVAVVWLVSAVMLVLILLGTGWLVLSSMSSSVTYR
jgi:energy-converting hydrogenase Eha subunit A